MKAWQGHYQRLLSTADGAVSKLEAGQRVVLPTLAGAPPALVKALGRAAASGALEGVTLSAILPGRDIAQHLIRPELVGRFHWDSLFCGGCDRPGVYAGDYDMTPMHFGQMPRLLRERPSHVVMALASPPDDEGYVSLGISVDYSLSMFDYAAYRVVEINPNVPRVRGPCRVPLDKIDAIVEGDDAPIELPNPPLGETDQAIARHIAERIPDGATIQIGYGAVPSAVAFGLTGHKHLGIHTEMFVDPMRVLIEKGVVDNTRKTFNPGRTLYTFAAGSAETYRFLQDEPTIEGHGVDYTNDPCIIAKHKNMVSVNATIAVDLTGQACSESIGGMQYSGTGGQVDFVRGATLAEGGRSFLATASTAKNGTLSCIVDALPPGAVVTCARTDIDAVVTEYGVAELRGRSLRERAQALIAIAHPKFRDELVQAARARGLGVR
ncbi:MAG: acetyl-CoA hydrolase/transferase family protein [Alphaproteobacteria bacterium]